MSDRLPGLASFPLVGASLDTIGLCFGGGFLLHSRTRCANAKVAPEIGSLGNSYV